MTVDELDTYTKQLLFEHHRGNPNAECAAAVTAAIVEMQEKLEASGRLNYDARTFERILQASVLNKLMGGA